MEKFLVFLPTFLLLLITGVAVRIWVIIKIKQTKNNYPNFWRASWIRKNQKLFFKKWLVSYFPSHFIGAPALEELLFRAPLLIYFDGLSVKAWLWIFLTSIIFGLVHFPRYWWKTRKIPRTTEEIILDREKIKQDVRLSNSKRKFDSLEQELQHNRFYISSQIRAGLKVAISTIPHGILLSYLALMYQSIILPVIVHAGINLYAAMYNNIKLVWEEEVKRWLKKFKKPAS